MGAGTAMGAAGLAAASAAQSAARDAECRAIIKTFDGTHATVEQRREYAACVHRIDGTGEPMDPMATIIIKAVVVFSFIGAGIGATWGWREGGAFEAVLGGALGAMVPWFISAIIAAVIYGIVFVTWG